MREQQHELLTCPPPTLLALPRSPCSALLTYHRQGFSALSRCSPYALLTCPSRSLAPHSLAAFRSPKEMVVKLTEAGGDVNLVEKNTRRISKEVGAPNLPSCP